ncbi:MAG: tripartite tricarboxylate transporter TctB family protein [Casimicrobiaceae bacterium]
MTETEESGPGWHALVAVAALLFGLAALIAFDVTGMAPAGAVGVGPTVAMKMVSGLLVILGVAHVVAAVRARATHKGRQDHELDEVLQNRGALAWVLGGLIGMIAILQVGGGFIIGSTCLFAATARAFGQPLGVKSVLLGFVLAAVVYAFFTLALTLSLPAGPLERLLG